MSLFPKTFLLGSVYCALTLLFMDSQELYAYVSVPRSNADTTDRMNGGGDPPTRIGLRDDQRSPEFLDDWWGQNDYYYSQYGYRETGGKIRDPAYTSGNPPYYAYPNTYYYNDPNLRYNDYNTRYYRSNNYPR